MMSWLLHRALRVGVKESHHHLYSCYGQRRRYSSVENYDAFIDSYRDRAKRTLVVQVRAKETVNDLVDYCNTNFGQVNKAYFHANPNSKAFTNFILVEFGSRDSLSRALASSQHRRDALAQGIVPVHSPFVWFAADQNTRQKLGMERATADEMLLEDHSFNNGLVSSRLESLTNVSVENEAFREWNFDAQLLSMYTQLAMDESSRLLRFLACEQIELAITGLFPRCQILPFGSSVNALGLKTSDLDMTIVLDKELLVNFGNGSNRRWDSRLHFHAKQSYGGDTRLQTKAYCQQISEIIRWFLPGCEQVSSILGARVPIIKYRQHLLNLECDLSLSSKSGYYMSELLFLYGSMHACVRPLVFAIRQWAKYRGLVEHFRPTATFTNFSLTLLLIFYLQEEKKLLPPLKLLVQHAREEDERVCEDGVNCTWLRDPDRISTLVASLHPPSSSPSLSLESLLQGFFMYYAKFDFGRNAVCVYSGERRRKRSAQPFERLAMYHVDIVNPLEREKNVSANVSQVTMHHFKAECRASIDLLDSSNEDQNKLATLWRRMQTQTMSVDIRDLELESDVVIDNRKLDTKLLVNDERNSNENDERSDNKRKGEDRNHNNKSSKRSQQHHQHADGRRKRRFSLPRL